MVNRFQALVECCLSEWEPDDDGIQLCGDCAEEADALGLSFDELLAMIPMEPERN